MAIQHSIVVAAWHMLTGDTGYQDLGGDYFTRLDPERAMRRIVRQANTLGFTVRFDPIGA
ncbi:hypothetical protein [Nocardia amamiensis]|uniref:hypothetical protein n=1 Tax=Nocardia amamiensis TaxID=404578 RepID=UPI001FE1E68F|nr:hypothetical protein [Nocardia amamiensis]